MKKTFITAIMSLALAVPVFAQEPENVETLEIVSVTTVPAQACTGNCSDCTAPCGDCSATCGECTDACTAAAAVPMTPEGPESKIANRMTQAEKARNAAENDSWGGAITIIAMCIVVSALAILSILFFIFGKINTALLAKKKSAASLKTVAAGGKAPESNQVDSGEVIAAIAMALSEHFGDGHDVEDTILTIRTMKRAYSPWNSKIYNLRQMPELHRNSMDRSAF